MKKLFPLAFIGALLFSGMAYALPIEWNGNYGEFGASGYWLGGSSGGGGARSWAMGEAWANENWAGGVAIQRAGKTLLGDGSTWNNYYNFKIFRWGLRVAPAGYIEEYVGSVVEDTGSPSPTPEPATMILLGTGLVGLAGMGRKKFKK